ncbi:LGFP repeat-containing protein [Nocardia fluminea]|uniref:LGFP repeat-containing protein n=1 Tax=Nocardia fluminea TaxID=134984 RepID=UPI003663BCD3
MVVLAIVIATLAVPVNAQPPTPPAPPGKSWKATDNPNATVVPGKMRSDREEVPGGFSKADADKAETMEATVAAKSGAQEFVAPGCQVYWPSPFEVCGAIKDKYNELGGPNSFLLWPTSNEIPNPDGIGAHSTFTNGPIYWSPHGGAHPVANHFFAAWQRNGWEAGVLGYPTSDEIVNGDGIGRRQYFDGGTIYWKLNEAYFVAGAIRDKWGGTGWEGGFLGYPMSDEVALPDGQGRMNRFENGAIYWHPDLGPHTVVGGILTQWGAEGYESGPAGYPIEDQRQISPTGVEQMFQGATHAWPRRVSDVYCGDICSDAVFNAFPALRALADLVGAHVGAPDCSSLPGPVEPEETFYECFAPTPESGNREGPAVAGTQPVGSILPAKCYEKGPGEWMIERHYSCIYLNDLNGHGVRGDRGADGGQMNYVDLEISLKRVPEHGRKFEVAFRAVPKLSGIAAKSILEVYPKCRQIAGNSCTFEPVKGWQQIYTDEPVEFSWTTVLDEPTPGQVTGPQIYFEMKHVSTGGTPIERYRPAPLPYTVGEAPVVRCDNYTSLQSSGCIFPAAPAVLDYGPSKNVPEVSWHVYQAQQSGLPGATVENPLHRATAAESDATRKIACLNTLAYPPRPAGKQCDEYPFAAAREGAQLSGVGTERTFHPECTMIRDGHDVFPETTGPTGFSVCMVNGSQNGSAGSSIGQLHRFARIDIGQPYIVKTYPGVAPVPGPR